jgi:ADP-ribose diphosphatase
MSHLFFQDNYYSIYTSKQSIDYIRVRNEVLVVPLTYQGNVIFTIEPSIAFGGSTFILPGGVTELDEAHEQTALRELQEEIGYTALRLDFLGEVRPFSKYIALQSFIYLARELVPSQLQGDERYPILTEQVQLKDLERLITSGQLLDARIIAALFLVRDFLIGEAQQ